MIDLNEGVETPVQRMWVSFDPKTDRTMNEGGVGEFFNQLIELMKKFGVLQLGCAKCDNKEKK